MAQNEHPTRKSASGCDLYEMQHCEDISLETFKTAQSHFSTVLTQD